jgi:hypothetical protein
MSSLEWSTLTNSLGTASVSRGVTAGIARPNGGGNFCYGFNSLVAVEGAVGLFANQVLFAPMAKGGSVRGALKRLPSGGPTGFAPFLFIGLQGASVNDAGYLLGLGDGDPHHIVLRKGSVVTGLPDLAPDPDGSDHVLMRSNAAYENDTWLHLRLDMIVQGTGDVLLQVYENDLAAHAVTAPLWTLVAGMEGSQYPTITGFVDDALGVNTGLPPYTSGRGGFAMYVGDVTRRASIDHLELARQL